MLIMAGEGVRAAAKLTGVSLVPGGIRGKAAEHLKVSSYARMPSHARTAVAAATSGGGAADEPLPRVVFDGVPTLEEANEATSELIAGIDEIYPCSRDYDGFENSVTAKLDSSFPNSQVETSVNSEITTEPVAPTTVSRAFRLLRESSEVQKVVASIACDPNVVKAVRENQQLQEFLDSERRRWVSSHSSAGSDKLAAELYEGSKEDAPDQESKRGFSFEDFLNTIKDKLSNLFKKLFGREANGDRGAPGASDEHVMEMSLLGLAIMVILLIFLKRN